MDLHRRGKLAEATERLCSLKAPRPGSLRSRLESQYSSFAPPFLDRSPCVLGDYVTMDQGTGAVHTAPSHGADDFYTGVKYGLDSHATFDEAGRLRDGLPEYEGMKVFRSQRAHRGTFAQSRRADGLRQA